MNCLDCNIVLLPNDSIAQKAYSLSKNLEMHDTRFTLEDGAFLPHASLYMTRLEESSLARFNNVLADIATHTPHIKLTAREYHQKYGYIDIEYTRTKIIEDLQMAVVDAINPIRAGLRKKDQTRLKTEEGKARENIEKYGYRSIGELFAPHITITRFKTMEPIDTTSLPNAQDFNTTFKKLALCEMGDNGTCVRIIAEFNFLLS